MQFYFAWVPEGSVFSPEHHLREDEKIFSFHLFEEEGAIPQARVILENPKGDWKHQESIPKSYCFIAVRASDHEPHLLFQGRLVTYPTSLKGETVTLDFLATSQEREQAQEKLLLDLKNSSQWEPLFLPYAQRSHPRLEDLLSSTASHVYWSRTDHTVTLSNHLSGQHVIDVGGNYFRDSLGIKVTHSPLEDIEIRVQTQWVQRYLGSTNLDAVLKRHLEKGVIETFTGRDLERKWWQSDTQFRPSGYRIEEADLVPQKHWERCEEFLLPASDPLVQDTEVRTQHFIGSKKLEMGPQKVKLKRKAYRPHLKVGWRYHQPRQEEVVIRLKHQVQPLQYQVSKSRVVHLTVHDLVESEAIPYWGADLFYQRHDRVKQNGHIYQAQRSHRSSRDFTQDTMEWANLGAEASYPLQAHRGTFFPTDRGQQVIQQGISMAKAYLSNSARCVDVSFICPLDALSLGWAVDHTVRIVDNRLPGGEAIGKVKKLTFEALGKTGRFRAYVTLGCCIGAGDRLIESDEPQGTPAIRYGEMGLFDDDDSSTLWSLEQERQGPEGILFPSFLGASDIVREISIIGTADEQADGLRHIHENSSHTSLQTLQAQGTHLKLRLEDLRGKGVLKTTFVVKGLTPWTAPHPLILGERT